MLLTLFINFFSFQNYNTEKLNVDQPLLLQFSVFIIFLLLLFYYKKYKKEDLLPFEFTDSIRGFSILIIIVHHLCRHVIQNPDDLYLFYNAGYIGVALFLFISGYGVSESFKSKGVDNFFYPKMIKIYLPFLLFSGLWLFLNHQLLGEKNRLYPFFLKLTGLAYLDRNYWFISFLFLLYIVFYFSIKLFKTYNQIALFLLITSLFILGTSNVFGNGRINAFSFLAGIIISFYKPYFQNLLAKSSSIKIVGLIVAAIFLSYLFYIVIFQNVEIKRVVLILSVGLFIGFYKYVSLKERIALICIFIPVIGMFEIADLMGNLYWSLSSLFAIIAIVLLFKILFKTKYPVALQFIGKISFELYLIHGAFMYSYDFILYKFPLYISFPLYLTCIIGLSYVIHILISKAFSKMLS